MFKTSCKKEARDPISPTTAIPACQLINQKNEKLLELLQQSFARRLLITQRTLTIHKRNGLSRYFFLRVGFDENFMKKHSNWVFFERFECFFLKFPRLQFSFFRKQDAKVDMEIMKQHGIADAIRVPQSFYVRFYFIVTILSELAWDRHSSRSQSVISWYYQNFWNIDSSTRTSTSRKCRRSLQRAAAVVWADV